VWREHSVRAADDSLIWAGEDARTPRKALPWELEFFVYLVG
jgi:hypothetical protein